MATTAGINLHADPSEISHHHHPASDSCHEYGTLDFGKPGHSASAHVFFDGVNAVAAIDAAIAALVALKQEMAPPVIDSERDCDEVNEGGWHCNRYGPHDWHHDDNGTTWRTGGGVLLPAGCDPDRVSA